ncbi:MAG: hypothetical protein HKN34_02760, partial [Gammaproteobacteria bacterium]|nr:hypothetical protein [Gammaproteobacteria bacterium]
MGNKKKTIVNVYNEINIGSGLIKTRAGKDDDGKSRAGKDDDGKSRAGKDDDGKSRAGKDD